MNAIGSLHLLESPHNRVNNTSILIKHQWDDAELPDVLVTRGVIGQYLPDAAVVLSPEVTS